MTHFWKIRDHTLTIGPRPLVMGIVNVTPDSFSDGGRHATTGAAAARRQDWQWQTMLFAGLVVAEYRTAPHMQPPWMSWVKCPPYERTRSIAIAAVSAALNSFLAGGHDP